MALYYYREVLKKKTRQGKWTLRDDYKELVETSMVLLGEVPPSFSWKKPGAAHKARFCSFGIYTTKLLLLLTSWSWMQMCFSLSSGWPPSSLLCMSHTSSVPVQDVMLLSMNGNVQEDQHLLKH